MKGKWARGIPPRFFSWIIRDKLAVSERPGGYARNHRKARRQEEILWLRGEGFTRVVSLLPSPHNLHAYDELGVTWAHIPFGPHDDPQVVLPRIWQQLRVWLGAGEKVLLHQEELGDRLMGVVAGYLRWSGMVPSGPRAITVVEQLLHRQMGPAGRELAAIAPRLQGHTGPAPGEETSDGAAADLGTAEPAGTEPVGAELAGAEPVGAEPAGSTPLPGPEPTGAAVAEAGPSLAGVRAPDAAR